MKQNTRGPKQKRLPAWAPWCIALAVGAVCAVALVYYWRVAFSLPLSVGQAALATGCAAVLLWAVVGVVWLLRRFAAGNVPLQAAVAVFCLGLLYCFATAPFQVPDESQHYLRAHAISTGSFNYEYTHEYPEDVQLLLERFPGDLNHKVQYAAWPLAPAQIEDYLAAADAGEPAEAPVDAPLMFLLLPFLPSGLFMAAARLFGLGALGLLYAGRLANLLVYAVICYFTFKNAARYRGVFIAFAMLPLSLFMAASCSYDCLALALCFFLLSYACKKEIDLRGLVWFLAALAMANYIKPLNFLLVGVLLVIPKERWYVKYSRWLVAAVAAVVAVGFWWAVQALDAGVLKVDYPALPRGSGEAADPIAQLLFVLKHPLRFVMVTLLSVIEADAYLFDLGRLGGMDLTLPMVGGLSLGALFLGSMLSVPEKPGIGGRQAVGYGLVAFLYSAAVLGGMYVADTDYTAIRISGPQPRYFLPAFLLLFILLSAGLARVYRPRVDSAIAAQRRQSASLYIGAAVALFSALLLFQYYFVGQWVPKSEGGFALVNFAGRFL